MATSVGRAEAALNSPTTPRRMSCVPPVLARDIATCVTLLTQSCVVGLCAVAGQRVSRPAFRGQSSFGLVAD